MNELRTPVVFIHGLWLHASSWNPWIELFRASGYEPIAPGYPGESANIPDARSNPEGVANRSIQDVFEHYSKIIGALPSAPILIGHSFGGLLTQKLMGEGLGLAGVAIDPGQIKDVLAIPLPVAYRVAGSSQPVQQEQGDLLDQGAVQIRIRKCASDRRVRRAL